MARDLPSRLKERLRLRRRNDDDDDEEDGTVSEETKKAGEYDDVNIAEDGGICMDPSAHERTLPNSFNVSSRVQNHHTATCSECAVQISEEKNINKKRKLGLEFNQIDTATRSEATGGDIVYNYERKNKEREGLIFRGIATPKPMLEAFNKGAWWDIEFLAVQKGNFLVHFLGYGDKEVPFSLVRHRLRRAFDHDCGEILEPGIDVAVYSTHPCASDINSDNAWYDGKIISINRRKHDPRCTCKYEVQLYSANEDEILQVTTPRPLIPGTARYYCIDHLGILQKPSTSDLLVMQREMRSETMVARVWSVDTKYLLNKLGNGCKELAASMTAKRISTITCPTSPGKSKIYMRACGVDIRDTPEQPQEANLLRVMPVEETEGNVSFQSVSVQKSSLSYKEHQSFQQEFKRKKKPKTSVEINSQNKSLTIGSKANTYLGAYLSARAPRKPQKNISSDQNKNTIKHNEDTKQRCLVRNITKTPRQGVIPERGETLYMSNKIDASEEDADNAFFHVKKKYVSRRKNDNEAKRRSRLLSSMIDMVVCIKRKGWQRKLFCLLSTGLRTIDMDSPLQHASPQSTSKYFKFLNSCLQHEESPPVMKGYMLPNEWTAQISRINTKSINVNSRKRKRPRSSESMRTLQNIRAHTESCKPSFKEFVKKVIETSSEDPKLDWNNLPSQRLENTETVESIPRVDVSYHEAPFMRKRVSNKYRPRNPVHRTKGCAEILDNSSVWSDGWSFEKLFGIRDDNRNLDWTLIPLKLKAPQVSWDPIIFHVAAKNIDEVQNEQGDPLEYIWKDMEFAVDKTESSDIVNYELVDRSLMEKDTLGCDGCHDFIIEEEEGLVCRSCGLVGCSIEVMLPPMVSKNISMQYHEREARSEDAEREFDMSLKLGEGATDFLLGKTNDRFYNSVAKVQKASVWDLIPELKKDMHDHQKDGFEFLWHNLVGSIGPSSLKGDVPRETGGCIISHAPGTGKTFLIISFLKSYLKLNPNCRPLILAPTIMLCPWQREFKKWNVDIPVHILNASLDSRRKRVFPELGETKTFTLQSGSRISTRNVINLHRMQVLSKWHEEESILIASYALFARLTDHENPRLSAFSRNIGKLLLQRPGLLILDEGHQARNHESKLRKSLIQVKTKLRILLSGTIFQNNCCELFNTFHLVRPTFMKDMFQSQGNYSPYLFYCGRGRPPKASYANLRRWKSLTESTAKTSKCSVKDDNKAELDQAEDGVESHNRRLFMENIGKTLENGQRKRGKLLDNTISKLRSMTQSFVHYYTGEILKSLPGLSDFTIFLKPSPVQERLLNEIAKVWDRKSTLELEYVTSNICIHPYLFKVLSGKEGCANVDLGKVGDLVINPQESTKVRFIIELLHLCQVQNEKLLIFSQNITPLEFLDDLLQSDSKFLLKGERIMKLHGSLSLDDRQSVIDCFNKPNGNVRALLASTKACGEGITLTGASRVVFLDILWNPAVMKQAMSRAFRLGQKKEVFVYRLVASGTLEEDKYKRTIWKDWLSRSIFESSINWENSRTPSPKLNSHLPKDSMASKGKNSIENDAMLAALIDRDREYKSILQIVKHDGCLDQGDISCSDMEDGEMDGNNEG